MLRALNNKGIALNNLGRYEEAIEYYDRALAIDPTLVESLSNKGASLHSLARYEEAIEYFDRALAIEPSYVRSLANKGNSLNALGRSAEAIEYYDRALALEPDYIDALVNKANIIARSETPFAPTAYQNNREFRILSTAFYSLITTEGSSSNVRSAILLYDRALENNPNDVTALTNKGIALIDLEEYPDAIIALERALQVEPTNSDCLCHIAIAYEKTNRVSEASDARERATCEGTGDYVDKPPATDTITSEAGI